MNRFVNWSRNSPYGAAVYIIIAFVFLMICVVAPLIIFPVKGERSITIEGGECFEADWVSVDDNFISFEVNGARHIVPSSVKIEKAGSCP